MATIVLTITITINRHIYRLWNSRNPFQSESWVRKFFIIRNWGGSWLYNQRSSLVGRRVLWAVINLDDKANTRMRIIENPDLMEAPALVLCKFFEFPDRRLFQSLSPPLAHKTASGFRIKRLSKGIEIFLSCQICRILTLSRHCTPTPVYVFKGRL